jgi:aldose sugar dehydrogenase
MKRVVPLLAAVSALVLGSALVDAQPSGPKMIDKRLGVRTLASDLVTPTSLAFLGPNDYFVLEKNTGRVIRITGGATSIALDLGVNFASERGLLGIALHPSFPSNPGVYLYWTCRSTSPPPEGVFFPTETRCLDSNMSLPDTGDVHSVPLIGNRVDRFLWNGSTLTYEHNLVMLRAYQNDGAPTPPDQGDEAQPARGNHDGGIIAFGPDGKLYVLYGDQGRRGQLQNLPSGPTATGLGPTVPDDQFGGPEPDDAHLSGVILRLNADGSTPADNPFFSAGAAVGGEAGENIKRVFAYGLRNGFGMDFDPISGLLWEQDNGEDAFDEINLVRRGDNLGWIQAMGPLSRVAEFRQIETTSLHNETFPNLQQLRWGPERIATTPEEAASRMFMLPGARYANPQFSWKHVVAPAAIGFAKGAAMGSQFFGDLFVGFSLPFPLGGALMRFDLTGNRRKIGTDIAGLEDRVDDNPDFNTFGESAPLVVGHDFGVVTDIETSPAGTLYVVSLTNGEVYEVFRK